MKRLELRVVIKDFSNGKTLVLLCIAPNLKLNNTLFLWITSSEVQVIIINATHPIHRYFKVKLSQLVKQMIKNIDGKSLAHAQILIAKMTPIF
jgi:hypothetical protein